MTPSLIVWAVVFFAAGYLACEVVRTIVPGHEKAWKRILAGLALCAAGCALALIITGNAPDTFKAIGDELTGK